jgi:hypothetical protein
LKLNQCGKHFTTLTRRVVPTKPEIVPSTQKRRHDFSRRRFCPHSPRVRLMIFRGTGISRLREHEIEIRTLLQSQIAALK